VVLESPKGEKRSELKWNIIEFLEAERKGLWGDGGGEANISLIPTGGGMRLWFGVKEGLSIASTSVVKTNRTRVAGELPSDPHVNPQRWPLTSKGFAWTRSREGWEKYFHPSKPLTGQVGEKKGGQGSLRL